MTIEEMNSPVAGNIKRILGEKGLKQGYIANQIGVEETIFSKMLNGMAVIKAVHVARIAEALGVSPDALFAE